VKGPIKTSITEHSAPSGASKWLRAMGMQPGDVLVQEAEEIEGRLIIKATRVERNGVVIKRTVAALAPLDRENGDNSTDRPPSVRSDPVAP
jgi:hypothetical protein